MSVNTYSPRPVDAGDVELPQDILSLAELLAENAHDAWAMERISEGWTYGEYRDDITKKHPCLVPYARLPDSEKKYDRDTALSTLKLITKLGYVIKKMPEKKK